MAAITIDTGTILLIVALLTAVVLMISILGRSNGWFETKVRGLVDDDIAGMQATLVRIETKVEKVDTLEKQQIALASQMNNGIKERLDGLEGAHNRNDVKLDGIADTVAGLKAMLELHLNWNGPDRRNET